MAFGKKREKIGEKMKDLIKNWKVLMLIALTVISIILIAPNLSPEGVVVTYKARDSPASVNIGDIILKINGQPATPDDLIKDYEGIVTLDTNKGQRLVRANGTLGITGSEVASSKVKFGLDIEGGTRAVIQVNSSDDYVIEQVKDTLQTRINIYGLKESSIRVLKSEGQSFIEIVMAGGTQQELQDLLEKQGRFEAKINLLLDLDQNSEADLKLSNDMIVKRQNNNSVLIDGTVLCVDIVNCPENRTEITIDGILIKLNSVGERTVNITTTVFTGNDVVLVYTDPQRSGLERTETGAYSWFFQVKLSQDGAQKFAYVTQNLDVILGRGGSGEGSLSSPIDLYLDGELIDSLSIAASLKGQAIDSPSITGGGPDAESALQTRRTLQTILRSGSLPTEIEIVQLEVVSPKLGSSFLINILIAITSALIAVSIIISIRYRKKGIIIPMIITSVAEVLIIFGASVLIGWTIDIAAIAAIIAIIGTGVDSQIVLIDQAMREGEVTLSMKEKIKRALFIIFGAGGTVIAAMLPLTILGLGVLRGFALTTIIGVLIGVFITRPAFGEMIKKIV